MFPYLLRKLANERSNQVWALDTTYIPMQQGFVYLTAVIDWASRKLLAHKVTITLEASHAVDLLEQALNKYGTPDIINTDQGSRNASRRKLLTGEANRWKCQAAFSFTPYFIRAYGNFRRLSIFGQITCWPICSMAFVKKLSVWVVDRHDWTLSLNHHVLSRKTRKFKVLKPALLPFNALHFLGLEPRGGDTFAEQ